MEVYDNIKIEMLVKHIQAKDEAIEKLTGYIKELIAELKNAYDKKTTTDNEKKTTTDNESNTLQKYDLKNTVVRWEQSKEGCKDLYERSRATGVVTSNGFLEFKRVLNDKTTLRTRYNSLQEWMDTLPKDGNFKITKR
jgi:CTP:phosphocholine cytidylyltransferase-like protein